jgi:TP901 family phage tail tape measure protein
LLGKEPSTAKAAELAAILRAQADTSEFKTAEQDVGRLESKLGGIGPAAAASVVGVVALGGAVIALGKQAFELGAEFDDAFDRIRITTGQTGESLQSLQSSFRAVAADTPASFEQVSIAIGRLNQRLGLTGPALESLSAQFLDLSRITGTDLNENLRLGTRLFGDWGVEVAKQADTLDLLFRASQATGQSVGTLAQQVVQFGAPLRQLGFGLEESLALLGKFERDGVNTEQVMGSLRIAIGNLAQAGIPLEEGFRGLVQVIGDMEDPTQATSLAIQAFGARAGPDMAAAIREGRFAVDELVESISDSGETIRGAADDTDDGAQRWQRNLNQMRLDAEPVATAVFELANAIAEELIPPLQTTAEWAAPLITSFAETIPNALSDTGKGIDDLVEKFAGLVVGVATTVKQVEDHWTRLQTILAQLPGGPGLPETSPPPSTDPTAATAAGLANYPGRLGINPDRPFGPDIPSGLIDPADLADEIAGVVESATEQAGPRVRKSAEEIKAEYYERLLAAFTPRATGPAATGGRGSAAASVEREVREVETALQGFMRAAQANTANFEDAFGQLGGRAASALSEAIRTGTGGAGASAFSAMEALVQELRRSGVADWRQLGDDLAGSFHAALEAKTPEARVAALAMITAVTETIAERSRLTGERFAEAFDLAQAGTRLGSQGASVMAALTVAIEKGGAQNIEALGRTMEGLRVALVNNEDFSPERAAELFGSVMEQARAAIDDGSPAAQQAFREFLAGFNADTELEALGNRLEQRFADIARTAEEARDRVRQSASEAGQSAIDALTDSRSLRGARENVAETQAQELANVVSGIDEARRAWQAYREDQALTVRQGEELADLQRRQGEELAKLTARLQEVNQTSSAGAPGLFVKAPVRDPSRELSEQIKALQERQQKELAALDERQTKERTNVEERRKLAEEDRAKEREFVTILTNFRKEQEQNRRAFEDALDDQQLTRRLGQIVTRRDAEMAAIESAATLQEQRAQEWYDRERVRREALRAILDSPTPTPVGQVNPSGGAASQGAVSGGTSGTGGAHSVDDQTSETPASGDGGAHASAASPAGIIVNVTGNTFVGSDPRSARKLGEIAGSAISDRAQGLNAVTGG